MKKIIRLALLFSVAVISVMTISSKSYAVPAFARQMGVECNSCHFQQFPLLNQFGRTFKAGGFIMSTQPHIEGDRMYLPNVLNASIIAKIRYQKTNGDSSPEEGTDKGELQFPDEAALFLGGQVGEHIGFALEAQFADPDAPVFASFKMPVVYDVAGAKVSVIPFSTDGLGASFGFELLNTGAVRNIRLTEHRKEVSAQQYLGTDGAATGFAFVAATDMGFINISQWAPVHGTNDNSFLNYFRVAATPQVGGWDLGIGGQLWSGTSEGTFGGEEVPGTKKKAEAWAVDAQAQGTIGSIPVGVYITYGMAAKTKAGETENIFNSQADDKTAATVAAEATVLPYTQVSLAYRTADNGKATNSSDDATALGVKYMLTQNVQLSLNHTIYSGDANKNNKGGAGDQLSTLMIFAAF